MRKRSHYSLYRSKYDIDVVIFLFSIGLIVRGRPLRTRDMTTTQGLTCLFVIAPETSERDPHFVFTS